MLLAKSKDMLETTNWVYVLACEDYRYYVGFTKRLHSRLIEHFSNQGSAFTRQYRPLRILQLIKAEDERTEFQVWCLLSKRLGTRRVGGYNKFICTKLGFKAPPLPFFTGSSYQHATMLANNLKATYTAELASRLDTRSVNSKLDRHGLPVLSDCVLPTAASERSE